MYWSSCYMYIRQQQAIFNTKAKWSDDPTLMYNRSNGILPNILNEYSINDITYYFTNSIYFAICHLYIVIFSLVSGGHHFYHEYLAVTLLNFVFGWRFKSEVTNYLLGDGIPSVTMNSEELFFKLTINWVLRKEAAKDVRY